MTDNQSTSADQLLDALREALAAADRQPYEGFEFPSPPEEPMTRAEERKERDLRVLEMRRAGVTFDRIAAQVGFSSRATAYKAYVRALQATGGPELDRDSARLQQVDRMDRLLSVFWPKAMKGDLEASREVRQIERLRAYLLGTGTPTATRIDAPDSGEEIPLASGGATVVDNETLERLRRLKHDGNPAGAS